MSGSDILSRPAEEFQNNEEIETAWVMKACEHADVYFNLLCSLDPKALRLTPHDDSLYKAFREEFPDLPVEALTEDMIKNPEAKQKWRTFCESYKDVIEDYNMGTLLRLDSSKDYSEENTVISVRVQFYAIELARNREGFNADIKNKYKKVLKDR